MFTLNDKWVLFWTADKRKWSPCDNIVWISAATKCNLGCKYCHDYLVEPSKLEWLDVKHLEYYSSIIPGRLYLTIALGDLFLSPNLENILEYSKKKDWLINAYTYFPAALDLDYVDKILTDYQNVILNWSLHRPTDKERQEIFQSPHKIKNVISRLKNRKYYNTIVIFSNQDPLNYSKLFKQLNKNESCINFVDFIDYERKVIEYKDVNFQTHLIYRTFHPSLKIMKGFIRKEVSNEY